MTHKRRSHDSRGDWDKPWTAKTEWDLRWQRYVRGLCAAHQALAERRADETWGEWQLRVAELQAGGALPLPPAPADSRGAPPPLRLFREEDEGGA